MSADPVDLSPLEMLEFRKAALAAAAQTHAGQPVPVVLHAAGSYLAFVLQGQPVYVIGQTITETAGEPQNVGAGAPAKASQPGKVAAAPKAAAPAKAAPAKAPAAAKPATNQIPAPTNIKEVADALKAVVQSKEPGKGRDAAVALLAEYGVTQLSQIPPAKLAEFKQRCETLGTATEGEPGDDLLG